ncbi:hypothetical protein M413DRAFT_449687 [Hebeloma cylindrosporum]|uniref:F-box domain-containing protein n=1 Tax=Hebeloma cylindrosporum TaxID=76867 RepID=A0A0C3BTX6_HEBCY|nr:hypothetical protein M413DRAFT_449687 [Hebeloma cylindrosporum h7]
MLPDLPLEIIENVLDSLAQDDIGLLYLQTCSLVCEVFLQLCRKHIFASMTINSRANLIVPERHSSTFVSILSTTPEIADHIRKLDWNISVEDFEDPLLPGILEKITKLKSLAINWDWAGPRWSENSLRSALLHLFHLPTLLRLEIYRIQDFVFTDLIPCVNLREFEFHWIEVTEHALLSTLPHESLRLHHLPFGSETSTAISKIGSSLRPDEKPIFNFAALRSVSCVFYEAKEFDASSQLFQYCSQLTDIDITIYSPPLTWAGIAKMLKSSIETLACLHFTTFMEDETGTADPLGGLVAELEEMRHQNVVEKIVFDVLVGSIFPHNRGDDWGLLDRVLTQPGWLKLKDVSLNILIRTNTFPQDELEDSFRSLPHTQFPRLSNISGLFQFSVNACTL